MQNVFIPRIRNYLHKIYHLSEFRAKIGHPHQLVAKKGAMGRLLGHACNNRQSGHPPTPTIRYQRHTTFHCIVDKYEVSYPVKNDGRKEEKVMSARG